MNRLVIRGSRHDVIPFGCEGQAVAFNGQVYWSSQHPSGKGFTPAGGLGEARAFSGDLSALDGMWAVATGDARGLTLSRDQYGIKPLYYRHLDHGVAFASDIPSLLSGFGPASVRAKSIAEFILFGRVLPPNTFFRGVRKLPPGGHLAVDASGTMRLDRTLGFHDSLLDQPAPDPTEILHAVDEALQRCLTSDRPIGIAVSGGIDSSLLAARLRHLGRASIPAFSVTADASTDGVSTIGALRAATGARSRNRTLHVKRLRAEDFPAGVRAAAGVLGEPTAMTSTPQYLALAELAAEAGVVCLLLGEGADELFGGYPSWCSFGNAVASASTSTDILSHLLDFVAPPSRRRWAVRLLGRQAVDAAIKRFLRRFRDLRTMPPLRALQQLELQLSLEPLLARADHALMSASIEGRTPYLHGAVPRLAQRAIMADGMSPVGRKLSLRRAAAIAIPQTASRPKMHFRAPIQAWFCTNLAGWLRWRLCESRRLTCIEIPGREVETLVAGAEAGVSGAPDLAFALASLAEWLDWLEDCGLAVA